ncbi:MAG: tetratricopeptide repeat protein [Proteobacteria bacterium]|nr:MAG: tetratricopeptide repeat protein [Pseudomonadota bacterium]
MEHVELGTRENNAATEIIMKYIHTALMMGVLAALVACGGAENRKAAHLKKGELLFEAGNYEKARLEFKNVLQIDPTDIAARYALAQTLEKVQNWRGAAGHYLAVLENDPNHRDALSRMGQIYLLGRNLDKASEHAEKILEQDPADADGLTLRAGIKSIRGELSSAKLDVLDALASSPGHANASALLASLYLREGSADKSIATLNDALAEHPGNATIRTLLARVHTQIGNFDEAAMMYAEIVETDPDVLGHRLRLASFFITREQLDEAEGVLKQAISNIGDVNTELAYAEFLAKHRSAKAAADTLSEMIEKSPTEYRLRFAHGKLYEAANDLDAAKAVYESIIELTADVDASPNMLRAKTRLAIVEARTGDRERALYLVEEVLVDNPRDQEGLKLRGTLSLGSGDAAAAIADYRAALRDDANNPDLLRLLARAHLINGEVELATDTLLKGIEAEPSAISLRADLVNIYSQRQELDRAVGQLDEVIKLQPKNAKAYEGLFKIRVHQKDWTKALEITERIKTAFPTKPTGFYFAGLVHQAEKRLPESIEQFESALAVSPDAVQPLSQLVKSHLALGHQDVAEQRLAEVIERNDKNFVAHNLLGELSLASKQLDAAMKSFNQAVAINPKWAIPYRNLASAYVAEEKNDLAVQIMEQGIEATGGSPLLVTGLAGFLERTGQLDSAIEQYRKLLADKPDSTLAANNLAMLLIEYKEDEASRKEARDLAKGLQNTNNAAYLDTFGWIEYEFGENARAVEALEKAVAAAPNSAIIRYHMGMAYMRQGNQVLAKDNLNQAIESNLEFRGLEAAKTALAQIDAGD